jgi:hypothetical protein
MIKSRIKRWVEHVARVGRRQKRCEQRMVRRSKEKNDNKQQTVLFHEM